MSHPLVRLFAHDGRARRRDFWSHLAATALAIAAAALWRGAGGLPTLAAVALLGPPLLAAAARRLHDTGRPAGLLLVGLVPMAGQVALARWLAEAGTRGANRYGVDPRGDERRPATGPLKPGFAAAR